MISPLLVVLDIDETLVHSTTRDDRGIPDFQVAGWKVIRRPHLDEFLSYCLGNFDVAVWTSGGSLYAQMVMEKLASLDDFRFIYSSEHCTTRYNSETGGYYPTKPLKKILGKGWSRERIIAIDDTPSKWESSYGNYLPIRPFFGETGDRELLYAMEFLETLKHVPSIQEIDKRNWRAETSAAY